MATVAVVLRALAEAPAGGGGGGGGSAENNRAIASAGGSLESADPNRGTLADPYYVRTAGSPGVLSRHHGRTPSCSRCPVFLPPAPWALLPSTSSPEAATEVSVFRRHC